jgi:hypothetical protein
MVADIDLAGKESPKELNQDALRGDLCIMGRIRSVYGNPKAFLYCGREDRMDFQRIQDLALVC